MNVANQSKCFHYQHTTMAALSCVYAVPVSKNDPPILSLQYKLEMMSLGTVWNENERFWLVFMKTVILMAKTGTINPSTGIYLFNSCCTV